MTASSMERIRLVNAQLQVLQDSHSAVSAYDWIWDVERTYGTLPIRWAIEGALWVLDSGLPGPPRRRSGVGAERSKRRWRGPRRHGVVHDGRSKRRPYFANRGAQHHALGLGNLSVLKSCGDLDGPHHVVAPNSLLRGRVLETSPTGVGKHFNPTTCRGLVVPRRHTADPQRRPSLRKRRPKALGHRTCPKNPNPLAWRGNGKNHVVLRRILGSLSPAFGQRVRARQRLELSRHHRSARQSRRPIAPHGIPLAPHRHPTSAPPICLGGQTKHHHRTCQRPLLQAPSQAVGGQTQRPLCRREVHLHDGHPSPLARQTPCSSPKRDAVPMRFEDAWPC